MKPLLLAALTAVLAGCTAGNDTASDVDTPRAPVSRGAGGDCVKAWNAPGNSANRAAAAAKHRDWSVALSEWTIDHATANPSGDDLVGEGCSYSFSSATHWRSYSGGWEADGDLRWNMPHEASGRRMPEQQIQPPNAVLRPQGKLARLAPGSGPTVSGREWRAVIDDWYDNGTIDRPHRCAAVRAAIDHVPTHGPSVTTAYEDLLEYADLVC
jgi:hypothetical protein